MLKFVSPLLAVVALVVACGGGGKSSNILRNPGFEKGSEPWYSMETTGWGAPFEVSDDFARSGKHSAHLGLAAPAEPAANQVFGVVQEIETTDLPEYVSGYYRVENWQKGTQFQYLQFVVIAMTRDPATGSEANLQLRYVLAGIDTEPFRIDNAKYVFVDTAEPQTGTWVRFGQSVRDEFLQAWGSLPQNLVSGRLLFEARYDSPEPSQPQIAGDVYYDDLYAGPAKDAPN